jgi:hypothetical protein
MNHSNIFIFYAVAFYYLLAIDEMPLFLTSQTAFKKNHLEYIF